MVMPVEQICPICGVRFLGSDCVGDPCMDCQMGMEQTQNWARLAADNARLTAQLAEAREALGSLRVAGWNLEPYVRWTISPESPGHHPTLPSALAAFQTALIDAGTPLKAQRGGNAALTPPAQPGAETMETPDA